MHFLIWIVKILTLPKNLNRQYKNTKIELPKYNRYMESVHGIIIITSLDFSAELFRKTHHTLLFTF